jgi:hypothetical protein
MLCNVIVIFIGFAEAAMFPAADVFSRTSRKFEAMIDGARNARHIADRVEPGNVRHCESN